MRKPKRPPRRCRRPGLWRGHAGRGGFRRFAVVGQALCLGVVSRVKPSAAQQDKGARHRAASPPGGSTRRLNRFRDRKECVLSDGRPSGQFQQGTARQRGVWRGHSCLRVVRRESKERRQECLRHVVPSFPRNALVRARNSRVLEFQPIMREQPVVWPCPRRGRTIVATGGAKRNPCKKGCVRCPRRGRTDGRTKRQPLVRPLRGRGPLVSLTPGSASLHPWLRLSGPSRAENWHARSQMQFGNERKRGVVRLPDRAHAMGVILTTVKYPLWSLSSKGLPSFWMVAGISLDSTTS